MRKIALLLACVAAVPTAPALAQGYYSRTVVSPKTSSAAAAPPSVASCGVPQRYYWNSGGNVQNRLGRTASPELGQKACNDFLATKPGVTGACLWNPANGATTGLTWMIEDAKVAMNTGSTRGDLYAAVCK